MRPRPDNFQIESWPGADLTFGFRSLNSNLPPANFFTHSAHDNIYQKLYLTYRSIHTKPTYQTYHTFPLFLKSHHFSLFGFVALLGGNIIRIAWIMLFGSVTVFSEERKMAEKVFLEKKFLDAVNAYMAARGAARDIYYARVKKIESSALEKAIRETSDPLMKAALEDVQQQAQQRGYRLVDGATWRGQWDIYLATNPFDGAYDEMFGRPDAREGRFWSDWAEAIAYEQTRRRAA